MHSYPYMQNKTVRPFWTGRRIAGEIIEWNGYL